VIEHDREEQLAMIDLNVRTLTDLSLAFVDPLARHRGGLLNVASIASFMPGPGSAVYYATKAYVLSFTEALHCELKPRGIRVTALCPGPVQTEFAARAGVDEAHSPPVLLRSPEAVADAGFRGLMAGRRVVIPGLVNRAVTVAVQLVPRRRLLQAIAARQKRRQAAQGT